MRTEALEYLACPRCGGALVADGDAPRDDGHILDGVLASACGARFPIRRGVPRLLPAHADMQVDPAVVASADRFGAEWQLFHHHAAYHARQLRDWLSPLSPRDFACRAVLDAGCGKGRHTRAVAAWGARAVVALDLGPAVDVAFAATRALRTAHVVQGDVLAPPVARAFDLAFSVGVLHHLPDPRAGFRALIGRVKPGGRVAAWVYGRESNEWIVRWVDPVRRRVTSRLPPRSLYWMTLPPSLGLWAVLRLYRRRGLAVRLPYGPYLRYISAFPAREVHHIVFDQLAAPIAHYLPRDEVERWLSEPGLADARLSPHNANSWRVTAVVTGIDTAAAEPTPQPARRHSGGGGDGHSGGGGAWPPNGSVDGS